MQNPLLHLPVQPSPKTPMNDPQTPEEERKHIENEILKNTWTSPCCGQDRACSKSLLVFLMQGVIALSVLLFCMLQLAYAMDPDNKAVYFSLISSLVTLYLPSPLSEKLELSTVKDL